MHAQPAYIQRLFTYYHETIAGRVEMVHQESIADLTFVPFGIEVIPAHCILILRVSEMLLDIKVT